MQLIVSYTVVNNSRSRQLPILAALSQQQIIHSNFQDNIIITWSYMDFGVVFIGYNIGGFLGPKIVRDFKHPAAQLSY